jgi:hypothetical protein
MRVTVQKENVSEKEIQNRIEKASSKLNIPQNYIFE